MGLLKRGLQVTASWWLTKMFKVSTLSFHAGSLQLISDHCYFHSDSTGRQQAVCVQQTNSNMCILSEVSNWWYGQTKIHTETSTPGTATIFSKCVDRP
jgi:hypothetical protein